MPKEEEKDIILLLACAPYYDSSIEASGTKIASHESCSNMRRLLTEPVAANRTGVGDSY